MDKCKNKNTSKESLKAKSEINTYSTFGLFRTFMSLYHIGRSLHTDEKRNILDTGLGREMCDQMPILAIHF